MIEFERRLRFDVFFVLQTKFELNSPVFMGVFSPTRRGLRDLTNISLSRLQTRWMGRIQLGDNLVSIKSINGYEVGLQIELASYRVGLGVIGLDLPRFMSAHPADY
jgi:hypothetical protein